MEDNKNKIIESDNRTGLINYIDINVAITRLYECHFFEVTRFRYKHNIPSGGFHSVLALDEWETEYLSDKEKSKLYTKDLFALAHKVGINSSLGSHYIHTLELELQFSNLISFSSGDYNVRSIFNTENNKKELWIEIYPNTRRDDIIDRTRWNTFITPRLKTLPKSQVHKEAHLVCTVSANKKGNNTILLKITGSNQSLIRKYWSRDVRPIQQKQLGFKPNNTVRRWILDAEQANLLRKKGFSSKKILMMLKSCYDEQQLNTLMKDYKNLIKPLSASTSA